MQDWIKILFGSGLVSGVFLVIGNSLGWIRFKKKDDAEVQSIKADVQSKKVEDEIKISKAALEWTVQLAARLETANVTIEKRQIEIDRLHGVIQLMRDDFEKRMTEMEAMLTLNQEEIDTERKKNQELLNKLKPYISGNKSSN